MMQLFQDWQARNLCQIQHRVISHRCAQSLCDLADALYPQLPRTESGNTDVTGHDGIYVVAPNLVQSSCGMTAGRPAMAILRSISVRPRGGRIRAC